MSMMSTNSSNRGNRCRWLRFEYERCWCRERACLKIVADSKRQSYGMLYFVCEKKGKVGGCNFFRWCFPVECLRECPSEATEIEVESNGTLSHEGRLKDRFVVLVACGAFFFFFAFLALLVSLKN